MKAFEIKEERFEIVREEVRRGFKNFQLEAPHQHAMYYLSYVIQDRLWTHEEKLEELEELTFEDVKNFVPQLLRHLHIESLIHGNISQDQAKQLAQSVEAILKPKPLLQSQLISSRESVIIDGANYVHQRSVPNKANVNSAIEYYCQVGSTKDTSLRARLNLLAKITQEPCFDQLRTKEQLGYLVFSGMRNHTTTMGLRIILQSEKEPIYLENRIEVFLEKLQTIIENMAEPEYQKHVDSLIAKKLAKNKNLWQESHRYWAHIHSGFYEFGQIDTDVQNLRNIPKSDLLKFYNEYVHPTSIHRKKVSIHLKAEKTPTDAANTDLNQDGRDHSKLADNNEIVSDLVLFKSSLPLSKAAVPMCELPTLE
ncbi:metalloprotease [Basidiobolus ranarum]|uniref:Metalloprotease n=1 Tax=Basidiobolus ranarum TaxID=34480 RepID=A0ABR2WDD5_9FUNG